jgi:hypothetical protein
MWRDLALSLSLANLCLLRIWARVVVYGGADAFHVKCAPSSTAVVAVAANLVLLWAVLWGFLRLLNSRIAWLAFGCKVCVLLAVLMALNSIRAVVAGQFPQIRVVTLAGLDSRLQAASAILLAAGLLVAGPRVRRLGATALLLLTPMAPMLLVGATAHLIQRSPALDTAHPLSPRVPGLASRNRVVWVIFDEWDFRAGFEAKPRGLRTPNIDRLAKESLFATQAHSPATDTIRSIPSLLTGERIAKAEPTGPADLLLTRFGASGANRWNATGTVFARARNSAINTAVAGWYFPYCRILAPALTACHWCEMARPDESCEASRAPVGQAMRDQMRSLFETSRFHFLGRSQRFEKHVRSYQELSEAGIAFAADPTLGFVFLHLPVPHSPYLRRDPDGTYRQGEYADGLALVDETVGRLLGAMASSGVWPSTHLVLSSDHSLRGASRPDPRIPFILRLAGDSRGVTYRSRFDTVVTGELLLRALRGELASHEAAAGWLDSRR